MDFENTHTPDPRTRSVSHISGIRLLRYWITGLLTLVVLPVGAQDIGANTAFSCDGTNPDWSIVADGDEAVFEFLGTADLIRALTTKAQGADWPRAHSYVGRQGSAIVILDPVACDDRAFNARVLTQGGETPLLLTGCCSVQD